jgi:hypothetical protein
MNLRSIFLLCAFLNGNIHSAELTNDRALKIHSEKDAIAKRRELIQHIWASPNLPTHLPSSVTTNIPSPVKNLTNLARVDELRIDLAPNLQGLPWHFIPQKSNRQLVVVHHGHACTLDDDPSPNDVGYGLQRTIKALLREGYSVLGVFMPRSNPRDCTGGHDALFQIKTTGNPIKFFLEPTAISLNYLKSKHDADHFPKYRDFHMTGLSGGGWTTTLYAAIDPTIRCSFPIAGSIPLYLRTGASVGDREQTDPAFYNIAGYPDLYFLGAFGRGRSQTQILLRKDDCCFGETQHDPKTTGQNFTDSVRAYESKIQSALKAAQSGQFRLEIDETAPSHMISHHAIEKILLPKLSKIPD